MTKDARTTLNGSQLHAGTGANRWASDPAQPKPAEQFPKADADLSWGVLSTPHVSQEHRIAGIMGRHARGQTVTFEEALEAGIYPTRPKDEVARSSSIDDMAKKQMLMEGKLETFVAQMRDLQDRLYAEARSNGAEHNIGTASSHGAKPTSKLPYLQALAMQRIEHIGSLDGFVSRLESAVDRLHGHVEALKGSKMSPQAEGLMSEHTGLSDWNGDLLERLAYVVSRLEEVA